MHSIELLESVVLQASVALCMVLRPSYHALQQFAYADDIAIPVVLCMAMHIPGRWQLGAPASLQCPLGCSVLVAILLKAVLPALHGSRARQAVSSNTSVEC